MKKLLILLLAVFLNAFSISAQIDLENYEKIRFKDVNGLFDGTEIFKAGGNALRIHYKQNFLIFQALDNYPIRLYDQSGVANIQFAPNGNSWFMDKVGFGGKTDPFYAVDVKGTVASDFLLLKNKERSDAEGSYVDGPIYFDQNYYPDFPEFSQSNGGGLAIKTEDGWGAVLATNNSQFMSPVFNGLKVSTDIEVTGNIGVGVTNPSYPLHIKNDNTILAQFVQSNYSGADAGIVIRGSRNGSTTSDVAFINFRNWDNNEGSGLDYKLATVSAGMHDVSGATGYLRFYTNSGNNLTEKMRIDKDGNVGIGTSSPDAKLTVKGHIHTQEVKVDLAGAVAPDYVFAKDYQLMTLKELENYINSNSHLPEVPSAAEMEEEGINLKEMNLLLLKKVEELTLHTIQQQKDIDVLKNLIQQQQETISSLIKSDQPK